MTKETTELKNVPMLISNVMKDLSEVGISKSQTNKFDNYKFRGIDDVYNTLSKILTKHNLVVSPSITGRETTIVKTAKGGTMNHTVLSVEYTFHSPHCEEKLICHMMGEAMDRGDKSINKAFSAAYKYLCLQVFCVPLEGEQESDSDSPEMVIAPINETQEMIKKTDDLILQVRQANKSAWLILEGAVTKHGQELPDGDCKTRIRKAYSAKVTELNNAEKAEGLNE